MPPFLAATLSVIFVGLVLTAALEDALSFTIPNWVSLALLVAFGPAAFAVGMPLPAMALNVGIGVAALVAGMLMFALRWLGGGDAKLLAAVSLWLGWAALPTFLIGTAMAGGALAVMLLTLSAFLMLQAVSA